LILLDTNYLIGLLVPGSIEASSVKTWFKGNQLCTSVIVWYEFLCGPVGPKEVDLVENLLQGRIFPFTPEQAAKASELFNQAGRPRRLRVDSMIAAAAIDQNAELATANLGDFSVFTESGLRLVKNKPN
jgi:predicted nucleic acid-binding protein